MPAINLSNPYAQNFDLLSSTGTNNPWVDDSTIGGWYSNRPTYNAGTGSSNTGSLYSFGSTASTERALGSVGSGGTGAVFWGVRLVNDTANTISTLNINYVGEQWRNGGGTGLAQTVDFQYQIGATNLTSGTWTDFNALDFTSPVFSPTANALDGNAAANRTAQSASLDGLTLAPGQEIWLRWSDIDHPSNDHGLAIDDFSVSADITTPPPSSTPIVSIEVIETPVEESERGIFRISRTGATTGDLTVNYTVATGAGQATNGVDYTPNLTGTVMIAAGASFIDIPLNIVDDAEVEGNETITLNLVDTENYDLNGGTATVTIIDNDFAPGPLRIHDIQGAAHTSPLAGTAVSNVAGIVTALRSNGFYLQDPNPDADNATSEGIFVFTSSRPTVTLGSSVLVSGNVSEFFPGGANSGNLSTTQISSPTIRAIASLGSIGSTVIGAGGRIPPTQVIDNDSFSVFDPAEDGIDFYESLEGMQVQVNNAVAVGPTSNFGEIPVLVDNGVDATGRTARGGVLVQPGDFNPERIIIDDAIIASEPQVNVNDTFNGSITGVIDYSFGNFKLLNTAPLPSVTSGGLTKEVTALTGSANQLTMASFNVENLDPRDGAAKFSSLANAVVNNLKSPDIISLEEIQDNNGATNDSIVDADVTYQTLINAIAAAGGPTYEFRQVNPVDDQDGGEPGGNIRVGFLFNPNRVDFVDRSGGASTTNTTVIGASDPELSASPGRLIDTDPSDGDAFANSRKPLAGEFLFNGNTVFAIANHFNSKGGDQPLFGSSQPPILSSEVQRLQQAEIVNNFVESILARDPNANVVALGDFNDFQFSAPIAALQGDDLNNLINTLPLNEQYTYVFEGNSQVLDHILVSDNLLTNAAAQLDVVHINAEFTDQVSDHDPLVSSFNLNVPNGVIWGTVGADLLNGTANNDTIYGRGGNDTINAQQGNDIVFAGIGNDIVNGNQGNDNLYGDAGDDRLDGSVGDDTLYGGDGNDLLVGGNGIDTLLGLAGDDSLRGDNGDDLLNGGLGNDNLQGGRGSDRFVLAVGNGSDVISDFVDNQDLIQLSGNLNFGQLTIDSVGNNTLIRLTSSDELLATLINVPFTSIDINDFVTV